MRVCMGEGTLCLSAFVSPVCTWHLLHLMSTEFQADPLCVGIQPDSGERVAPTTKGLPPTVPEATPSIGQSWL